MASALVLTLITAAALLVTRITLSILLIALVAGAHRYPLAAPLVLAAVAIGGIVVLLAVA